MAEICLISIIGLGCLSVRPSVCLSTGFHVCISFSRSFIRSFGGIAVCVPGFVFCSHAAPKDLWSLICLCRHANVCCIYYVCNNTWGIFWGCCSILCIVWHCWISNSFLFVINNNINNNEKRKPKFNEISFQLPLWKEEEILVDGRWGLLSCAVRGRLLNIWNSHLFLFFAGLVDFYPHNKWHARNSNGGIFYSNNIPFNFALTKVCFVIWGEQTFFLTISEHFEKLFIFEI